MDLVVGRYRRGGNRYRQISHKAHRAIVHEQNPSTPDHSRIIPESSRQASREPDDFSRQGSTATGQSELPDHSRIVPESSRQASREPDDFSRQGSTATGQSEIPGLPFCNVKRSQDFSSKDPPLLPLEFQHPPSSDSENYRFWMSDIVKEKLKDVDEQTKAFGPEIIALSWLQWFRKRLVNKRAPGKPPGCFSEGFNSLRDLFNILSYQYYSRDYPELEKVKLTLFAALVHDLRVCNVDIREAYFEGTHILHYACHFGYAAVVNFLLAWGVDANVRMQPSGMTALHLICGHCIVLNEQFDIKVIDLLHNHMADLTAETTPESWTPLFFAIQAQKPEVLKHLFQKIPDKDILSQLSHQNDEGNTPLHMATKINAVSIVKEILTSAVTATRRSNKASTDEMCICLQLMTARNNSGVTPIHYAALHCYENSCLRAMQEFVDHTQLTIWYTMEDANGRSPLDYAAKARRVGMFEHLWEKVESFTPVDVSSIGIGLNHLIKKARSTPSNWGLVNQYLKEVPKAFVHSFLEQEGEEDATWMDLRRKHEPQVVVKKSNSVENTTSPCSPPKPLSLHDVLHAKPGVYHKEHLEAVRTFLDATVFGDEVVLGKAFDADKDGVYDETSVHRSLTLHDLLTSDLPVWGHLAIMGWISNGIWQFGWWIFILSLIFYLVFLGSLFGALYLGSRPEISPTNLALQYTGAVTLTPRDMWRMVLECVVVFYCLYILVRIVYDFYLLRLHYFRLFSVFLRIFLVLFLFILIACRAAAIQSQWIVASLFFLAAAFISLDYLIIFTYSNVYVLALWVIIKRDVLKFLLVASVLTIAFSGGLYFAFQAEQPPPNITTASVCMNGSSSEGNSSGDCVPTGAVTILYAGDIFSIDQLLLSNFQTVTHGLTFPYNSYDIYTILLYLSFIMIILLLMINALIAQISHRYDAAQTQASQLSTYARARFLMLVYPGRPVPCCHHIGQCRCRSGCIKSNKFIWINRLSLFLSKNSERGKSCSSCMKYCLKRICKTCLAIFGKGEIMVTEEHSKSNDDISGRLEEVKERVDSLAEIMVNPSIRENPKDVLTGFPSSRHSNDTSPTSSPLNSVFSGSHHNHATTSSLRNPKSTSTDCSSPNANQVLPWRIKQENAPPLPHTEDTQDAVGRGASHRKKSSTASCTPLLDSCGEQDPGHEMQNFNGTAIIETVCDGEDCVRQSPV